MALLEEKKRRRERNRLTTFSPYEWQRKFYGAGPENPQRLLMAANRVGKTFSEAQEFAYHATGLYPDDWPGIRFAFAPKMWALGVTGEQIRDVIQTELLGDVPGGDKWGTGAIPADCIIEESIIRSPQTRGLVKDIKIRHISGAESEVSFKAYSQGQKVLMGSSVDFIWIDEEPDDEEIYPQCVTRTATGNRGEGGYVVLTFTPENGYTELIRQFTEELKAGQFLMNVTWDDAPHLNEEVKAQILAAIPEYQRDMRSKGIPILGSGVIYPISDEAISCEPFECPDHFFVINGMDFGWDHPQAHVQLWIDRDQDITYVARAWRKSERDADQAWNAVKKWAKGVPVAWPHDGLQHEKGGGEQLKAQYAEAGFTMLPDHATWAEGGNAVEPGLWALLQEMRDGKFKVFSTLTEWFEEKRMYHRDKNGRVVKVRDDLLSATRYAAMMRREALPMRMIKDWNLKIHNRAQVAPDFDPYD